MLQYQPDGIIKRLCSPTLRHRPEDSLVEIQTRLTVSLLAKYLGYLAVFLGALITVIGTWTLIAPIMVVGWLVLASGGIAVYWEKRRIAKAHTEDDEKIA